MPQRLSNASPYSELTIVIQAGGESKRMGNTLAPTKALVLFLGEPLVLRIAKRLAHLADNILITVQKDLLPAFEEAFSAWEEPSKIQFVCDSYPQRGALPGMLSALSTSETPYTAIVACDTPFVAPRLIEEELQLLLRKDIDACLVRTRDFYYEPMQAVYATKPCLDAVQAALDAGERRAAGWLSNVRTLAISAEALSHINIHKHAFFNANTPEDIAHGEQLARSLQE